MEAKGNIEGVDVEGKVDVGYQGSSAFSSITPEDRVRGYAIGVGGNEPITADLRPLTDLIAPEHFGEAWTEDLIAFRDGLGLALETLFGEPDIYPVLQSLEIWQATFTSFEVLSYANPARSIYGRIKLNRSSQSLQSPGPGGLDASPNPQTGRLLWNRANQPEVRVVHNQPEQFSRSGLSETDLTFYLVADELCDNPALTVNVQLHDHARGDVLIANKVSDLSMPWMRDREFDKPAERETFWVHITQLHAAFKRVAFDDLPAFKRLEISHALSTRAA